MMNHISISDSKIPPHIIKCTCSSYWWWTIFAYRIPKYPPHQMQLLPPLHRSTSLVYSFYSVILETVIFLWIDEKWYFSKSSVCVWAVYANCYSIALLHTGRLPGWKILEISLKNLTDRNCYSSTIHVQYGVLYTTSPFAIIIYYIYMYIHAYIQ